MAEIYDLDVDDIDNPSEGAAAGGLVNDQYSPIILSQSMCFVIFKCQVRVFFTDIDLFHS